MIIYELKNSYPNIKNTMALSYIPNAPKDSDGYAFSLPKYFDDSVYILERRVPKRLAIIETNKLLVDNVDYVVVGVVTHYGGAYKACEYAYKRKKTIINVIEDWEN